MTMTLSLVEVQPSTVISLNDRPTASARAACRPEGCRGIGREHSEHRRHVRRQHRGPLCDRADDKPSASTTTCLGTVSVVKMACAAAAAHSAE